MKKLIVCIMIALLMVGMVLTIKAESAEINVWIWPNYEDKGNIKSPTLLTTNIDKGEVLKLEPMEREGYVFLGYSLKGNSKIIPNNEYIMTGKEESLEFYANWKPIGYYYPDGPTYGRYYVHPALKDAIKIADRFSRDYSYEIANVPYVLRSSFDKAYNSVLDLQDNYFTRGYGPEHDYLWNTDVIRERFYKYYNRYPYNDREIREFYYHEYGHYYPYEYSYLDRDYIIQEFRRINGYTPSETELRYFWQKYYGYEYRFYDSYYDPYYDYRYYGYNYEGYNRDVKIAVDRLVDSIRDIAQYYKGAIFLEYGDLDYIDIYGYEWSGYSGYRPISGENTLKELLNEGKALLEGKDRDLYSELYKLLEEPILYAEKAIRGRANENQAIKDLKKAIVKAKEFKLPADRLLEPYMIGNTDGKFYPDKTLTRGELAVMLNRILGLGQTFSGSGWAEIAANNLKGFGYLQGDPDGNLLLDKPISMKEMATLLVRMKGYATIGGNVYPGRTTWATPYIQRAWAEGWLNDMNEVEPETLLTRGQVARMVNRAFKREKLPNAKSPVFSDVPKMHKYYHDIKVATSQAFVK